jgi:hypothetical protein
MYPVSKRVNKVANDDADLLVQEAGEMTGQDAERKARGEGRQGDLF